MVFFMVDDYTCGVGGAAPVNPCPRSARGGAVFFMVLPPAGSQGGGFFVVYGFLFVPLVAIGLSPPVSGVFGVFRLAVVCCRSGFLFASSSGGSVASSSWGVHRLFLVSPFVDKIRLNVDFICIFADIFVTLYYI